MVLNLLVVKQIYEKKLVVNKCAVDEWIWEVINRHRMVVQAKSLVDIKLILKHLCMWPVHLAEDSTEEVTVIEVATGK